MTTPTIEKTSRLPQQSANEEHLEMAMNAAQIGTFDWNIVTGEVFRSSGLERAMGLPPGGFGRTIEDFSKFVHPEDRERVLDAAACAMTPGSEYNAEFRMLRPDGSERWVQSKGRVHFDENGKPARMVGIDVDISERKLSEHRLRAAEKQYSDFYDFAPDLLFSIDVKTGNILECNQTACISLGYGKGDLVGRPMFDFYHPDCRDRARKTMQAFLQTGQIRNVELQLVCKDGHLLDISMNASAVREDSEIVRTRSICRDITELKRAAQALRRSEETARARAEELAAILDAVPALTVIAHDPECKSMTSSRSAYELLRVPVGGNTSKTAPIDERPQHFEVLQDGAIVPANELPVQKAAATGQAVRNSDMRIAFDDGTYRDLFGHAVPLLDERGGVRGAVGAFLDITDWKEAEEKVRKSEARVRRFIDSNFIGMITCHEDGTISEANDVFLNRFGYTREEFVAGQMNWKSMTAAEFATKNTDALDELKRSGIFTPFEGQYLCKDGTSVPVLIGGATTNRSPLEWMCFVLDQTEQKRLKELKTRELGQREVLAHEIRAREEERRRIARELHDETGQMMASLLAGLRAVADAKSLKMAKSQAIDLRKIATTAIDELGRLARGLHPFVLDDHGLVTALKNYTEEFSRLQGLVLSLHVEGLESRRLASDLEVTLYRITQEALTNISKHARAKTVEIRLVAGESFLDFSIADDGRGFNVASLPADYSGKHLGLRSMRERAVMLCGEFNIQSRDGGGTIKTFHLPIEFAPS